MTTNTQREKEMSDTKKPVLTVTRRKEGSTIYRDVDLSGPIMDLDQQASELMVNALITTMLMQFQPGQQDIEAQANKIRMRISGLQALLQVCDIGQDTLHELMS